MNNSSHSIKKIFANRLVPIYWLLLPLMLTGGCATMGEKFPNLKFADAFGSAEPATDSHRDFRQHSKAYVETMIFTAAFEKTVLASGVNYLQCRAANARKRGASDFCRNQAYILALVGTVINYVDLKREGVGYDQAVADQQIASDTRRQTEELQRATQKAQQMAAADEREMRDLQRRIDRGEIDVAQAKSDRRQFERRVKEVEKLLNKGQQELAAWEKTLDKQEQDGMPSSELADAVEAKRRTVATLERVHQRNLRTKKGTAIRTARFEGATNHALLT